jgi:pimeloyl-ACP methyl ester carboxylesterase
MGSSTNLAIRSLGRIVAACIVAGGSSRAVRAQERPMEALGEWQRLDTSLTWLRARSARDYAITSPNRIDEGKYVEIGGIRQWITIRGEDRSRPVLLFLHGGPGDATNPWGYAAFRQWIKRFTVVQWDQRGAGRTYSANGPATGSTITVDRMVQDGIELAELLRRELGREKIVLVGHSWGSILGALMAKARPALFVAFVGTGQVADPARSYPVAYRETLARAVELGDDEARHELEAVGPPPWSDGRGYGVQHKWANRFEHADRFIASMLGFALQAPGSTLRDLNDWSAGQVLSANHLVPETSALPRTKLSGEYRLPVFVIQGANDYTTPTALARELVDSIRAPAKEFVTIEGGHFAVFVNDGFLDALAARVLPLAVKAPR